MWPTAKPRKYDQKTPKKMIKLALRSALSDRANDGKVIVVDGWGFDAPSTKAAVAALGALGVDGSVLIVHGRDDIATIKSFRNLGHVQLIEVGELNAYDVLCNDTIVFTKTTLPGEVAAAATKTTKKTDDTAKADAEPARSAGSHEATEDGSEPKGFPIKGNADSMLYHVPGSRFYNQTVAEVWFATEEDAEAAGYSKPPSQLDADETTSSAAAEGSASDEAESSETKAKRTSSETTSEGDQS